MKPHTHIYIGRMPVCGCIVGISSYSYELRSSCADFVAQMIRGGLIVEGITVEEYRTGEYQFTECTHGDIVGDGAQQPKLV